MIPKLGTVRLALPLLAAPLVAASCTALDEVFGPPGEVYGRSAEIVGEIRSIDTRRGRLEVREGYRRRTWRVYYDRSTRVYHRGRRYPVTGLRRGDDVRIRVVYDQRGRAWAERVEVRGGGW